MPDNTLSPLPLMELATGFWSFKTPAWAYELELFEQTSGTSGATAGSSPTASGSHRARARCC